MKSEQPDAKVFLTIREVVGKTGLSRTKIYDLMAGDELENINIGRRRLIPADGFDRWCAGLRAARAAGRA